MFSMPAAAASYVWSGSPQFYSATGYPAALGASDSLAINAGPTKYLDLNLGNAGAISAADTLTLWGGTTLTNGGLYDLLADVDLSNAYGGNFVNNASGTLRKSGGTGTSNVNLGFTNNGGVIEVQTGTLNFNSGAATFNDGTRFSGAGQAVVSNNASFNDGFTTAGNLLLTGGTSTGGGAGGALMNGNVAWTGGFLAGTWTVSAGNTLSVQSGAAKYVNASLTNQGTIAATDTLYLWAGNTLTNQALYDLQGDFDLSNAYGGNFVNNASGTLRKSGGGGFSNVDLGFTNNGGVIEVQTGILNFNSGAATFNDGTRFSGAGQAVVSSNANFNGGFTTANNLQLTGGTFTGGGAQINGNTAWTGGTMAGTWTVAAGATLSAQSGVNVKYVNGSVTNQGTIAATDVIYVYGGNTLTNSGVYDLQGDFDLLNAYGGNFVNQGTLVKSAGTGTSAVALTFTNGAGGVVKVQTGTIDFNNGDATFGNGAQFTGAGAATVSNNATFKGGFTTAGNLRLTGGTFTGVGAQINGNTAWTGGTMAGTWTVGAGNTLSVQSGAAKYVNASLTNQGTIAGTDTLYVYGGNTLTNNGLYDLQGDVGVGNAYGGSFVNNGVLRKSSGAGTSPVDLAFSNPVGGRMVMDSGTIALTNAFANAGTLDFGLSGLGSFGTLALAGSTALGGQVGVHFLGNYLPNVGDSFQLITYGSYSGGFTNASWAFADGSKIVTFDPIYNSGNFTLTVQSIQAVPEPATYAFMILGLALIGGIARRRGRSGMRPGTGG